ncbi:DNA polymerase delta subunit 1 [Microdochium nivale]|nr:DNA polymerase delta subunit 1 [Microdochium nivale]
MDVFRVRLNCMDHYQAAPTKYDPQLRNNVRPSQRHKEPKVSVVRIFGSTETGQKVCVHIHGAFPYLYIEYPGSLDPDEVAAYIYRLHLSIDHALAVSYRRDVYDVKSKFVARITLVKGTPFFGMHVGYKFYLKIYMLNPLVMTRLSELLLSGVIMKQKLQPHEAHLQYLLQFMTDYNLYGCDYLDAKRAFFRAPVPRYEGDEESLHIWHSQSVPQRHITDDADLPRVSRCSIEVDICVQDILNRLVIHERRIHHDFVERKNPIPSDLKLVHSMAGLWKDETKRRKRMMRNPDPGSSPFPPEVLVSMSADPRNSQPAGWLHEEEHRESIGRQIQLELEHGDSALTLDTFVNEHPFAHTVKTALQSVEDLYPENLLPSLRLSQAMAEEDLDPQSSIMVDEDRIVDIDDELDLFPDDSDEELLQAMQGMSGGVASKGRKQPRNRISTADPETDPKSLSHGTSAESSGEQISSRASGEASLDTSSPDSLPEGVYASALVTGTGHGVGVSTMLLTVAEEHGLVSKVSREPATNTKKSTLKRVNSVGSPEGHKRRRVGFVLEPDGIETANADDKVPRDETLEPARPSSQRSKSTPKIDTPKKPINLSLNFPVVKDPNDPHTKIRLSQQSNSQPSQKSDDLHKLAPSNSQTPSHAVPSICDHNKQGSSSSSNNSVKLEKSRQLTDIGCAPRARAHFFVLGHPAPILQEIVRTLHHAGRPDVIYQDAYYSKTKDVPPRLREYAGKEFRLEGSDVPFLPDFDATGNSPASFGLKPDTSLEMRLDIDAKAYEKSRHRCSLRSWEIAQPPPSIADVQAWCDTRRNTSTASMAPVISIQDPDLKPYLSQIEGPTQRNRNGFKYSQKKVSTSVQHEVQYMSTMSLEIHINTRGKLVPNPEEDEVQCIFWCTKSDETFATGDHASLALRSGMIVLSADGTLARRMQKETPVEVLEESSELDLMVRMVEIVRTHDPDVLTGYEVHGSSWGYLIERARLKYDYNLCDEFSRMKSQSFGRFGKEADRWGFNTTSTIRVTGRHMINIWRAMRSELTLLQYTMENVVWHILHKRIPHYPWRTLTDWYTGGRFRDMSKLLRYYSTRVQLDIEILEASELIPRTSEQARLLGVDFFSVFSRGSQFKVESIMFRIAKPENFILVSPDRRQVGGQNALECLPLVMEPQSAFYSSPVLVLDFQSLYPSVMIAYNYCYSTFLGRINNWRGSSKMGFSNYKRQQMLLALLKDHINISPNGMMYCKTEVRKSLLAKMLTEILETRVMVKSGMKQDKEDRTLQRLLNNRQLALKLLANVTYGYTSASFSGRMPCSEIADSIVQTARETLERSIALIHSVDKWKAEVVYGDTDSLFIHLPGRTKDQAFDIGNEIAQTITDMNPRPVKLKFEKVYHPCVLLAKKRYVGYKYESKDQVTPEFDAKGIETVRRDGTPAEQKIEEKALKLLFETADLSQVKAYFQKQCSKIMRGDVSVQDFSFAKEVKLGTYSDRGPPPPGALISTKRMLEDARAEPQYGERVPYVVVTGAPGARLIDRCIAPEELLVNSHLQLDAEYYISKNLIPPLERIFNLVGANVRGWYDEMPKVQRIRRVENTAAGDAGGGFGAGAVAVAVRKTLESYMKAAACLVCSTKTENEDGLCDECKADAPRSLVSLQTQLKREEGQLLEVHKICQSCAGLSPLDEVTCDSKDCPVFYTRMKQAARYRTEKGMVEPAVRMLLAESVRLEDLDW